MRRPWSKFTVSGLTPRCEVGLRVNQKSGGYPCDSCITAAGTSCLTSGIVVCKVQSWEKPLLIFLLPDACIEHLAGCFHCDS